MKEALREQFINASLRFKKVDICVLSHSDVHLGELIVMGSVIDNCVCSRATLNVAEIQDRLHVSKPAVSQILKSLEKKGCIIRDIAPDDRRKITVTPTEKGQEVLQKSSACYNQVMDAIIERFGEENVLQLVAQLNQLVDVCEEIEEIQNETTERYQQL